MAPDEKRVLRVHLITLFGLWSIYVACGYRSVEALPPFASFVLHEAIRLALFAGIPLCWTFRVNSDPLGALGLRFSGKSVACGLAVGILYAGGVILAGVYLEHREFRLRYDQVAFWTTGLCLATIVEELSFRSFLLGVLHFRHPTVAVVCSAACFALIHVPGWWFLQGTPGAVMLAQLVSIFILGSVLAIVFLRTRSLYAVIIIHALNNLAAAALH